MIEFALHVIEIAVKHGNTLFEIIDLLVLCKKLSFVGLDVILQDSDLVFTTTIVCHGLLQSLQEFIFSVIKVLDEGSHALHLGVEVLVLLLLGLKLLLSLTKVILEALLLILDQGIRLLQINDLKVGLVLRIISLNSLILAIIDLPVQPCNLLSRLTDILLKRGIIALNSLQFLLKPQDLVLFELSFSCLLLELALNVPLLVFESLQRLVLGLYFTLSFKTALYSCLDLKTVLLE